MPDRLIAALSPARLDAYRAAWATEASANPSSVSANAVTALYVWQVSLSSAWFETLAYTEAAIRHAVDHSLRDWNHQQGRSTDWLDDAAKPLHGLVSKSSTSARIRAHDAATRRHPSHPRHGAPVTLDDRVAQLDFGGLAHLFPQSPPTQRHGATGLSARENLWAHGLHTAFPNLNSMLITRWRSHLPTGIPAHLEGAYGVGSAMDRLRRLRNRVFHHEQTLSVTHAERLKDVTILLRSINHGAAEGMKRLDSVRRTLAMRPHP